MRTILLISFLICPLLAAGQVVAELGMSYGTYNMDDMATLQKEIASKSTFPGQTISSFPGYWGFEGLLGYTVSRKTFGIFGGNSSTGGRYSYSDYSGDFQYDQLLSNIHIGIYAERNLSKDPSKKLSTSAFLKVSSAFTSFQSKSMLQLTGSSPATSIVNFKSTSFLINPGFSMRYAFSSRLAIKSELSYVLDTQGKLEDDEEGLPIILEDHSQARSDWSGVRVAAYLVVRMGKDK